MNHISKPAPTIRPLAVSHPEVVLSSSDKSIGVAETKYEFMCRDVPCNVSTGFLTSSQILFILQI
ncbi:hypothetical protein PN486_07900, partial [Nodularia spumigena CS-587/03]|nr:hypothetical protein [Nodularia spumigena CS-587/03]